MRRLALMVVLVATLAGCQNWQARTVAALGYGTKSAALAHKAAQLQDARQVAERVATRPDASVAMLDAELAIGRERRALVSAVLLGLANLLDAWSEAHNAGAEPSFADLIASYCRIASDYPEAKLPKPEMLPCPAP